MTNNAAVSSNKYLLAIVTALTSNSFSYKIQVFSSTTTLYSTILEYFVYNKLDPLIQALQISSLHVSLDSKFPANTSIQLLFRIQLPLGNPHSHSVHAGAHSPSLLFTLRAHLHCL